MAEHLIHIGYPKAGSTFLQRWFADHPEMAFHPIGIGGCGDVYELVRQSAAPDPRIRCRVTSFEGLATPDVRAGRRRPDEPREGRGPDFAAQQRTCAILAALFPGARILIVTRGFRSILLSGFSEYVRSGGRLDLAQFLASRPDGGALRYGWHYDALIGLYEAAFGDRLIVLPWELLRDDRDSFIAEIERRLALSHFDPTPQRLNPSLSQEGLLWYPRIARSLDRLPIGARLRKALLRRYVGDLGRGRLEGLVRLLQRMRPAAPVAPELITDEMLAGCRGTAERLRDIPLFAPYRREYLL